MLTERDIKGSINTLTFPMALHYNNRHQLISADQYSNFHFVNRHIRKITSHFTRPISSYTYHSSEVS